MLSSEALLRRHELSETLASPLDPFMPRVGIGLRIACRRCQKDRWVVEAIYEELG